MKKAKLVQVSAASMLALSAITPVVAFANETTQTTPAGFYLAGEFVKMEDFQKLSKQAKKDLILSGIKDGAIVLVQDGKVFDLTNTAIQDAKADEVEALAVTVEEYTETTGNTLSPEKGLEGEEIVKPDPDEKELVVESVSAINQTIAAKADQALKVQINGDKEVTAAELEAAGYTVEFAYNFTVSGTAEEKAKLAKGIIDATDLKGFKYAVTVTPAEGEAFAQTEFASVTVTSATTATSVDGVKLVDGSDEDYKLDYVKVGTNDVDFKATGAKNAFGEALEEDNFLVVESVKNLTTEVAYYENGKIVGVSEGTAEFEVKFKDIKDAVKVTVEVKEASTAKSLKETSAKVTTNGKVEITVLDQHGVEIEVTNAADYTVTVTNAKGEELTSGEAYNKGVADDKLTVEDLAKGSYTVEVTKDGAKLGTVDVEVIDATKAVADSFKVVAANSAEKLEITSGNTEPTKDYTLQGIANGVTLDSLAATIADLKADNGGNGNIKISVADTTVATTVDGEGTTIDTITETGNFKVKALKAGTTTATIKFVAGGYSKTLATLDIVVTNTTPQYTKETVTIKDTKVKAIELTGAITKEAVEAKLAYNTDKALEEGSVTAVKLLNTTIVDGKVTGTLNVTFGSVYGGKTVGFPVEITPGVATPSKTLWATNQLAVNEDSTYDEAIYITDDVVTVNIAKLNFDTDATEQEAFWTATAQQSDYDNATAAFGGFARVSGEEGYAVHSVFSNNGQLKVYEDDNTNQLDAWLQIGKRASNGAWTFLAASDVKEDVRTIIWNNATTGAYVVNTFTVEWVNETSE